MGRCNDCRYELALRFLRTLVLVGSCALVQRDLTAAGSYHVKAVIVLPGAHAVIVYAACCTLSLGQPRPHCRPTARLIRSAGDAHKRRPGAARSVPRR